MEVLMYIMQLFAANSTIIYGIIAALIGIFLIVIKKKIEAIMTKWLDRVVAKLRSTFSPLHYVDETTIRRDHVIHELLVELRTKTYGSRTFAVQFHNGSTFTTDSPIWRMTMTHETVKTGVSSCLRRLQSILASAVLEFVGCFWPNMPCTGISKVDTSQEAIDVYKTVVSELPPGYAKTILEDFGVKQSLKCAIKDDSGNLVGYVGIHFNEAVTEEEMQEAANQLEHYSLHIGYTLLGRI